MANAVLRKYDAKAAFTKTLASLASSTSGVGRQTTVVANSSNRKGAIIFARLKSNGSAPTAGAVYKFYLGRGDDASSSTYRSDNAGSTDAAHTVENMQLLGQIVVTATANKSFYAEFDTEGLGPLGPEFFVTVVNSSGQALSATEGDHLLEYVTYYDEVQ